MPHIKDKHANISIFVPHIGCPHRCSFCDQRTISGTQKAPTGDEVREICEKVLREAKSPENTEIAFFGGSFTAIPRTYMTELLEAANQFIGDGRFRGIRISTRPDCIDREILDILKKYGVTAIELGAQSMCDHVLEANERGHSAEDVVKACGLIREYGFELGLQMMIGLYKSTQLDEFKTLKAIEELAPDTVRLYPVVILKGTKLGELYESGEYTTFDFDWVVLFASLALEIMDNAGIRVIKCGLHASEFVERDMIGGFYHPAFRELCESSVFQSAIFRAIKNDVQQRSGASDEQMKDKAEFAKLFSEYKPAHCTIAAAPGSVSKAVGHKKSNVEHFRLMGIQLNVIEDESLSGYEVKIADRF